MFKLTVTDAQGLSGSDTVSIIVHPDPLVMSLVELTLTMEATVLTQSELDSLHQKLVLLIGDNTAQLHIRELKIEHKTGQIVIVFYVEKTGVNIKTSRCCAQIGHFITLCIGQRQNGNHSSSRGGENPEGEILARLHHSRNVGCRYSDGDLPKHMLWTWSVQPRNTRLHVSEFLDAGHILLLGCG